MCWTTSETALGRSALVPSSRDLVAASGSPLLRSQGFGGIHRSDTEYHYHRTTTSPDPWPSGLGPPRKCASVFPTPTFSRFLMNDFLTHSTF